MRNKKTIQTLLVAFTLAVSSFYTAAFAYGDIDVAHRFANYNPTVLENDAQAVAAFRKLENGFKKFNPLLFRFGTQCTARAETWSYELDKTMNIKSEKVFVFYTMAYHDYYYAREGKAFKWWFHVSPYVLVKNSAGAVEERVMDKAFADQPQTMKDWTDIFIKSKEPCIENVPFANFEGDVTGHGASYNKTAHCYIVRAPMYDLYPENIDNRERGETNNMEWDLDQVKFAAKALTPRARDAFFERVGIEQ